MPNYVKRGLWLRGVARHLEDQAIASLLDDYADRMMHRARAEHRRISTYKRTETMPAGPVETA